MIEKKRAQRIEAARARGRRKLCKSYSKFTPVRKVCSKLGNEMENLLMLARAA